MKKLLFQSDEDDWFNIKSLPPMLEILVENARKNSWGNKGNSFAINMKDIASYIYIRAQKSAYEFLGANMSGPSIWTVKSYINENTKMHLEGEILFDEFVVWLELHDFPKEIVITEDGTKIMPKVEYCASTNCLTGLVAPIDKTTGFPNSNFFKVRTGEDVAKFISTYPVSSYVQVFLGVPNVPNAPSFVLGFFGTDNSFLSSDVSTRTAHLKKELEKRGVKVLGTSTDGDSRPVTSLKIFMEFGKLVRRGALNLLANPYASFIGNIDGLHKAKGLVDRLFTLGVLMRLGDKSPSVNHLMMVYKFNERPEHDMTLKDLDVTDHMNYA
jgi:hypothetical protein